MIRFSRNQMIGALIVLGLILLATAIRSWLDSG